MLMYPLIIMVKQVSRTYGVNVSLDCHGQTSLSLCLSWSNKFPGHMVLMYPLIVMVKQVYHCVFNLVKQVSRTYGVNVSCDYHGQTSFQDIWC